MKPFSFSNLPIPVLAKFCAKVAAALIRPSLRRCNVSALGLLPAVGPGLCLFCADDSESPITPLPDEDDEDEDDDYEDEEDDEEDDYDDYDDDEEIDEIIVPDSPLLDIDEDNKSGSNSKELSAEDVEKLRI